MQIRQAILIASAVRYSDSKSFGFRGYANSASIVSYVGNDIWAGTRTARGHEVPNSPWSPYIDHVLSIDERFHEYLMETYFAVIRPDMLDAFLTNLPGDGLDRCDQFFRTFIEGQSEGEPVLIGDDFDIRTARILYLEPTEDVLASVSVEAKSSSNIWINVAQHLSTTIKQRVVAAQPALVGSALLFRGLENSSGDDEIVFSLDAISPSKQVVSPNLAVSDVVFSWTKLQQLSMIEQHLSELGNRHRFLSTPLESYVARLRSAASLTTSYDQEFVKDRISGSLLALRIRERIAEIEVVVKDSYVTRMVEKKLVKRIEVPTDRILLSELDWFLARQSKRTQAANQTLHKLESYGAILADVLRDAVNIEGSRTNILLQKSMKGLTYGGIAVAVTALLVTLLTDSNKQAMLDLLAKLFSR